MSRSKWKAPVPHTNTSNTKVILPRDVSSVVGIYNGRTSITLKVSQPMVGHRLGEFSLFQKFTGLKRKINVHSKR
jgi:ribosomal protein S19